MTHYTECFPRPYNKVKSTKQPAAMTVNTKALHGIVICKRCPLNKNDLQCIAIKFNQSKDALRVTQASSLYWKMRLNQTEFSDRIGSCQDQFRLQKNDSGYTRAAANVNVWKCINLKQRRRKHSKHVQSSSPRYIY